MFAAGAACLSLVLSLVMNQGNPLPRSGDKTVRVVLVDDHTLFRAGIRALLQQMANAKVVGEAKNEAELDRVLASGKPELVLMDLHLPGASGVDLTRRILAAHPGTKVIALSSDPSPELVHAAVVAGVSGYILKENAVDELELAITSVISGRTYFCAEVSSTVMNNLRHGVGRVVTRSVLTEREVEIVRLIADGKRNKEIADALGVTPKSAETFRLRVMRKLELDSSAAVTRFAIREGLIKA